MKTFIEKYMKDGAIPAKKTLYKANSQEFSLMIMQGLANKLSRMNEKHKEMLSHLKDFTERLEGFASLLHSFAP